MEKVFDAHIHHTFDIPMCETIQIFKEEFEQTATVERAYLEMIRRGEKTGYASGVFFL